MTCAKSLANFTPWVTKCTLHTIKELKRYKMVPRMMTRYTQYNRQMNS